MKRKHAPGGEEEKGGHSGAGSNQRFVAGRTVHTGAGADRVARKSSRGTELLPSDSALSPSRSSKLFPAPRAPQNTAISSISSAWLRDLFSPPACVRACVYVSRLSAPLCSGCSSGSSRSAVSVRGASLSGFGRLRQSVRGSVDSRKQQANISGVRGQRLTDSNPIKHRLKLPWRRAGAGTESSRAVPC